MLRRKRNQIQNLQSVFGSVGTILVYEPVNWWPDFAIAPLFRSATDVSEQLCMVPHNAQRDLRGSDRRIPHEARPVKQLQTCLARWRPLPIYSANQHDCIILVCGSIELDLMLDEAHFQMAVVPRKLMTPTQVTQRFTGTNRVIISSKQIRIMRAGLYIA